MTTNSDHVHRLREMIAALQSGNPTPFGEAYLAALAAGASALHDTTATTRGAPDDDAEELTPKLAIKPL